MSHTALWTWWSNTPPSCPPLDAILSIWALAKTTTSASSHSRSPNKRGRWVKACQDWLGNRQRRASFPVSETSVNEVPPSSGLAEIPPRAGAACLPLLVWTREARGAWPQGAGPIDLLWLRRPRSVQWPASARVDGGGWSSLVDDVGQRSLGGYRGWWGSGDGGLHQRSRLFPPLAAAPRGPAAPAPGNAPALDGGSRPSLGTPGWQLGLVRTWPRPFRDAAALKPLRAAWHGLPSSPPSRSEARLRVPRGQGRRGAGLQPTPRLGSPGPLACRVPGVFTR